MQTIQQLIVQYSKEKSVEEYQTILERLKHKLHIETKRKNIRLGDLV